MDILFSFIVLGLGIYGVWAVRRDVRRGVATARGFQFSRHTQPKRNRALTAFNVFAVALFVIGAIIMIVRLLFLN